MNDRLLLRRECKTLHDYAAWLLTKTTPITVEKINKVIYGALRISARALTSDTDATVQFIFYKVSPAQWQREFAWEARILEICHEEEEKLDAVGQGSPDSSELGDALRSRILARARLECGECSVVAGACVADAQAG